MGKRIRISDYETPTETTQNGRAINTAPDPVKVLVNVHDFKKMLGVWEECAEDLKAEIDSKYAGTLSYPSEARKHRRDVEVAELSLSMVSAFRSIYDVDKFERT